MTLLSFVAWLAFALVCLVAVVTTTPGRWRTLAVSVGLTALVLAPIGLALTHGGGQSVFRCLGRNLGDPASTPPPGHAACLAAERSIFSNQADAVGIPAIVGIVVVVLLAAWVGNRRAERI